MQRGLPLTFSKSFLVHKAKQLQFLTDEGFKLITPQQSSSSSSSSSNPPPSREIPMTKLAPQNVNNQPENWTGHYKVQSAVLQIAKQCKERTFSEVRESPFYSILWDRGSDFTKKSKAGLMIRQLRNSETEVKESFLELASL